MTRICCFIFIFVALTAISFNAQAQQQPAVMGMIIENGDTIYIYNLEEAQFTTQMTRADRRAARQFNRLMRDVNIVMPYAKMCSQKLEDIDRHLASLPSKRERDAYMQIAEKQLKEEFEDDLKNLTFTQGKLLLKLVDRETGKATFNLIKEYRNGFNAFFWQNFARLFGMDLKERYDPENEPQLEIVIKVLGFE